MHHVLDSVDRNLIFNAKQTISPPWQKVSSTLGLPWNIQNVIFKTVTMTNKTEKAFSPIGCAMKWKNYNFMTSWWLPANCLPTACQLLADCLPTACRLLANCLPTACQLPAECLPTACRLPADCLPTACRLPADCLLTACWLPPTAWWMLDKCLKPEWWLSDNCLKYVWQHERQLHICKIL